ncbi:ATP-binding protein [Streptomyces sp. DT225]
MQADAPRDIPAPTTSPEPRAHATRSAKARRAGRPRTGPSLLARGGARDAVGSTGLGLDIVRRVAESTGGDVRIGRSVLGGTEVRVWIGLDGQRPRGGGRGHRVGRQRRPRAARRANL